MRPADPLRIEQRTEGAVLVLELHGELDIATAGLLPQALGAAQRSGFQELLVDLRGLTILDSTGVRSLLHTRRWMFNRGGRARFVCGDGAAGCTLDLHGPAPRARRRLSLRRTRSPAVPCGGAPRRRCDPRASRPSW